MSDQQQDTTEAQEQPQEATGASQGDAQPQEVDQEQGQNPNAEAKKYRLRLRETETELQAAQERVAHLQRRMAETALEAHLAKPGDLWEIGGQDAAAFYDDDGDLDRDRLQEAARQLTNDRPGLSIQRGAYVPKIADPTRGQPKDNFTDAFKPRR